MSDTTPSETNRRPRPQIDTRTRLKLRDAAEEMKSDAEMICRGLNAFEINSGLPQNEAMLAASNALFKCGKTILEIIDIKDETAEEQLARMLEESGVRQQMKSEESESPS